MLLTYTPPSEALAACVVVGLERYLGVEREALQRSAQLPGQGQRPLVAPAALRA